MHEERKVGAFLPAAGLCLPGKEGAAACEELATRTARVHLITSSPQQSVRQRVRTVRYAWRPTQQGARGWKGGFYLGYSSRIRATVRCSRNLYCAIAGEELSWDDVGSSLRLIYVMQSARLVVVAASTLTHRHLLCR